MFTVIILSALLLFSCIHQPIVTSALYAVEVPANRVSTPEKTDEKVVPVKAQQKTPLETAFAMVKSNALQKYWAANKDDITVYADIAVKDKNFTVVYDIIHAEQKNNRFQVPFSIEDLDTKELLTGSLDWYIEADESGLLLSFDDDYVDAWEHNLELFARYEAHVTFFVQGKPLDFSKLALTRGHDIGYHTIHHLNLPQTPKEIFMKETVSEVETFRNAGIPLRSFAYPFGLSSPWMHDALFHSFAILRGYGVTFHVYDTGAVKNGYIAAKAIDNILYKNDEEFEAVITLMLRTVKFTGNGSILPLCTHNIANTADWGIKPARLEYLLKTARELRLKFYLYKDFID
jgi:peptidoglycan/xylan/chitin deacetylase (PgdA/CDA1 family)